MAKFRQFLEANTNKQILINLDQVVSAEIRKDKPGREIGCRVTLTNGEAFDLQAVTLENLIAFSLQ
jgi:hypothetical protein